MSLHASKRLASRFVRMPNNKTFMCKRPTMEGNCMAAFVMDGNSNGLSLLWREIPLTSKYAWVATHDIFHHRCYTESVKNEMSVSGI